MQLGEVLSYHSNVQGIRDTTSVIVLIFLVIFAHVNPVELDDFSFIPDRDDLERVLRERCLSFCPLEKKINSHMNNRNL